MLPYKLIYHAGYDLNLGDHVFPSRKYRMIHDRLIADGFASPQDFEQPAAATDDQVLLVHEPGWVQRLKTGTLSALELLKLEIPFSPQVVEGFWLATGGTITAAHNALRDRIGFNIGGGFHHAFPAHGEGFCAINDVAIAVRTLQQEGVAARALIVDCDVHHGNGTAAIFAGDTSVLTLSIHHFDNYPSEKPPSVIDIHLRTGVGDQEYLTRLGQACRVAMEGFQPDILFYLAGADPYEHDQLGGLSLTMQGLQQRDRLVLEIARARLLPVAIVLAGGYASDVEDTVTIHCNTAKAARDALSNVDQIVIPGG